MPLYRPALLLVLMFALAACANTSASQRVAVAPAAAPATTAANDQLYALAWVQTSIEFQSVTRTIYASATRRMAHVLEWHQLAVKGSDADERAAAAARIAAWNAMPIDERANNDDGQPLAIILDADETVIDNSPYQARRFDLNSGYDRESWAAWVAEQRAAAIPGAVEFTRWAAANDIAVFYISNRGADGSAATVANLRALGFPHPENAERVLLLDDSRGFGRDKVSRRQLVDRDYRVIGVFGDNIGDFISGTSTDVAGRQRRLETYRDWWGDRWYALPNPMYGSWVDALTAHCDQGASNAPRDCMNAALRRN